MEYSAWHSVIQDGNGAVVSMAKVTVRNTSTGALAKLYNARDGSAPKANPFNADENGQVFFFVAGGAYTIKAEFGSQERTWPFVPVGTAAEYDIDSLALYLNSGVVYFQKYVDLATYVPLSYPAAAVILADPDALKNGYYTNTGTGWVFGRALQDTISRLFITGGAVNTPTATVGQGINPSAPLVFYVDVTAPNTASVTLNVVGLGQGVVLNAAGNPLAAGEWLGRVMLTREADGRYRIMNDPASALSAASSATVAGANKDAAIAANASAQTAKTDAETARTQAQTAKTGADTARDAAQTANSGAQSAKAASEAARDSASTSAVGAATSASNASGSATAAANSASGAAGSNTSAGNNATAAAGSATAAGNSAGSASTSATNAANSASASQTSRVASEAARDQSVVAKNDAVTAKTASETARDQSVTAKTQAEAAKTAADGSKTAAATSATNAAASATSASNSASAAGTSATNSAGSAVTSANEADRAKTEADRAAAAAGGLINAVQFVPQTLTTPQQQQARTNIGAQPVNAATVGAALATPTPSEAIVDGDRLSGLDPVGTGLKLFRFSAIKTWIQGWLTKAMVGLGNADNTSDANKPVSTAQTAAIGLKLDKTGQAADSAMLNGQTAAQLPISNAAQAALDGKAGFYIGSTASEVNYPIGYTMSASTNSTPALTPNQDIEVYLRTNFVGSYQTQHYSTSSRGARLTGIWRVTSLCYWSTGDQMFIVRRVA